MMKDTAIPFAFPSAQGCNVSAWKTDTKKPVAAVQIVYGMAEYKARYRHFAEYLSGKGIRVYIHDHLGHGRTAASTEQIGTLPSRQGWQMLKEDIHALSEIIREENDGLPHFLMGHSMGSFLVRSLLMGGFCDYTGIILSGSPVNPGLLAPVGRVLARIVIAFKGRDYAGKMLHNMVYASNNASFRPGKTEFDWLSRDLAVGEKFLADPLCGKVFSAGFYLQLGIGAKGLFSPLKNSFVPVSLPMLIISGSRDPVGAFGKGPRQAFKTYTQAGLDDLELKIYPEARHELINETNKDEVYADILDWITRHLNTKASD